MLSGSFVNATSFGAGGPKPNLLLDFLTGNLDSKVTFSRGSHATYFNSSGVLTYASNNVIRNNSTTGATGATPASPGTTPTNWTATTSGTTRTISSGTIDGLDYIDIQFNGTTNAGSLSITFDTATGCPAVNLQPWALSSYVAIVGGSLSNINAVRLAIDQRTAAGGFLVFSQSSDFKTSLTSTLAQFSYTLTTSNASTAFLQPFLKIDFNSGVNIDITLRIARPQLEIGSTVTAVNNTSGTAYYGPRFDYDPITLQPRGLLIEESRTNSIRNSTGQGAVADTPGTLPTNWFVFTTLTGLSYQVVAWSTEDGIPYIDFRLHGTPSGNGSYELFPEAVTNMVAATGQTWSGSSYYKLVGGTLNGVSNFVFTVTERDNTGAYYTGSFTNQPTPTINWQRTTLTRTMDNKSTNRVAFGWSFSVVGGATIDVTIRLALPQCENNNINTGVASATVSDGGSGYNVGDILEVVGGTSTTKTRLTVATLSGSAVATVTVSTAGSYSVFPTPQPVSVTPITGTGINATFNITPQTQTGISTSAIPTYSVSAQRNQDNASMTGTNFSSWYNQNQGTMFAEGTILNSGKDVRLFDIADSSFNLDLGLRRQTDNTVVLAARDPANKDAYMSPNFTTGTIKMAGAWQEGTLTSGCYNGGTVGVGSTALVSDIAVATQAWIGRVYNNTGIMNGYIRRVAYYSRPLANSELKIITN